MTRGVALSLLVVAAVACDAARAAPDTKSGLAAPAGWQPLPDVAKAAHDGLGPLKVDGTEAWGETARGCYAVWLAVASPGPAEKMATDILESLASPAPNGSAGGSASAPVVVRDVVKPTGPDGILRLGFSRGIWTGKLAARLGGGRMVALACFANQREPASCEAGCTALLGGIR